MLRQYNEEKGPFALAMKLARKIRTERDPLLGQRQALRQRRYLLLMAFVSLAQDVPLDRLFTLLCSDDRSEEHTSELQSLMRISYAVFCLKKKKQTPNQYNNFTQDI